MANTNCSACEDLRQNAPNLIVNGLGSTECTSLKNNTGLSPSSGHNDCTDLDDMNDCLIGNMEQEIKSYEVCDWKEFMKNFIPNVWTMFKGIICSICGMWTKIEQHECEIKYLYNGASFSFHETESSSTSRLVPGKGCDFSIRSSAEEHSTDIFITYIAGGLATMGGSVRTFTESFKDANGETQSGNSMWNFTADNYSLPKGGELMYELRIKKSEYPQISRFFNGHAFETGADDQAFTANINYFNEGSYAYGQHGWCESDGSISEDGYSKGHLVPDGWLYVQLRMASVTKLKVHDVKDGSGANKKGTSFSPRGFLGVRMKRSAIEC